MLFESALQKVQQGKNLSTGEAREAFDQIFTGDLPDSSVGAFLLALAGKGEATDELLGAVQSMRARMIKIKALPNAMDIAGTGGDHHQTLNISTAVAFVVAACGVPVAKHGNRAATSRSGSSDVLRALGVHLEPGLEILERCLLETNICFLFAPRHHPSMRHVATIRKQLGVRTIFNLLGPLTNPANVKYHLIGVYEQSWLKPMAEVLKSLGSEVAWLAHGQDGMDEITTTSATDVAELKHGAIKDFTIDAQSFGLNRTTIDALRGGDAANNADAIRQLLRGTKGPYRDIVLLNAASALVVASKADNLQQGIKQAAEALDSGKADKTLNDVIRVTNS